MKMTAQKMYQEARTSWYESLQVEIALQNGNYSYEILQNAHEITEGKWETVCYWEKEVYRGS